MHLACHVSSRSSISGRHSGWRGSRGWSSTLIAAETHTLALSLTRTQGLTILLMESNPWIYFSRETLDPRTGGQQRHEQRRRLKEGVTRRRGCSSGSSSRSAGRRPPHHSRRQGCWCRSGTASLSTSGSCRRRRSSLAATIHDDDHRRTMHSQGIPDTLSHSMASIIWRRRELFR